MIRRPEVIDTHLARGRRTEIAVSIGIQLRYPSKLGVRNCRPEQSPLSRAGLGKTPWKSKLLTIRYLSWFISKGLPAQYQSRLSPLELLMAPHY